MSTSTSISGKNGKKPFTITIRESDVDTRKKEVTIDPIGYGLSEHAALLTREDVMKSLKDKCEGYSEAGFFRECTRILEILRHVEQQGITSCIYEFK